MKTRFDVQHGVVKHIVVQLGPRTWTVGKLAWETKLTGYLGENNTVQTFSLVGSRFATEAGALHDARVRNNREDQ